MTLQRTAISLSLFAVSLLRAQNDPGPRPAGPGSEANAVIGAYNALPLQVKQDLLNFLRSL